jgi:nucleotide-binding universal stress UspA family protein
MKTLVAYDGSEGARRALAAVAELLPAGAAVRVIAVAEGVPMLGYAGTMASPEQDEERRQQLTEAERVLGAHGMAASSVLRSGDPASAILAEAESEEVGLIVLGTRGLSTAERWLVGSVSTKVLHHAHCSVLVAR